MILLSRLLCCLLVLPLLLPAAERAALVIGVNRYASFPEDKQLSSPINDAQDVARKLASMGFVVQSPVLDGTRQAILDAKRRFLADASGAQVALFYFSGHGFQVGDENYLIPSDMPSISSFTVLREHAVQLRDSVMAGLEEAGAGTKIIILDCCRDNPFAGQIAAALGTKSLRTKGGGGEISGYGPGFFLAFASSPGAVALDGNGARNSPFTAALLHHLDTEPGADLRDLFDGVKSTVSETNGQDQVPWVNDSLNRQHVKVLAKLSPVTSAPLSLPAMSEAEIERRALEKAREMAAKMAAESGVRKVPKGFNVPDSTLSPDHRFGVMVPIRAQHYLSNMGLAEPKNCLIELATGRVLTVIKAETAWDNANHQVLMPTRWNNDGSLLLWEVDGKWFHHAFVLMKVVDGQVKWQVDILKSAQQEILARTKMAAPKQYAAAKKENQGSGPAYPEGFSIDVGLAENGSIITPLRIKVVLSSNPKQNPDMPSVYSHMDAVVDSNGRFEIEKFSLGHFPMRNL